MPPKVRFDRELVIQTAFELAREKGMEALNARAIAQRLGCSTQPLYRELQGMEELKSAVLRRARAFFEGYILERAAQHTLPYLGSGLAYLAFAQEEGPLFRLLFMRPRSRKEQAQTGADDTFAFAAQHIEKALHCSREEAQQFHYQSFIFVHGLAAMLATGFMEYDEQECIRLLRRQYRGMRMELETREE